MYTVEVDLYFVSDR